MKSLVIATAFAFATMTSVGLAEERAPAPQKLTEAQMGQVTAGALLTVVAIDVVDIENNQVAVQIPVTAATNLQVGILSNQRADSTATGAPGRIDF